MHSRMSWDDLWPLLLDGTLDTVYMVGWRRYLPFCSAFLSAWCCLFRAKTDCCRCRNSTRCWGR